MSIETFRSHVNKRFETDYIMPIYLPFLPVALAIVGVIAIFIYFPYGLTFGIILYASAAVIDIYVLYKWIKRRNDHFRRQILEMKTIVDLIRKKSFQSKIDVDEQIDSLNNLVRESEYEETEKSAALWIILTLLVSVLIFYVYHFLTKDFRKHEFREERFLEVLNRTLEKIGLPSLAFRREHYIPERNTVLYVILTVLTIGLFGFYWVYVLTKDPNNHFKEQIRWEDELISIFEKVG